MNKISLPRRRKIIAVCAAQKIAGLALLSLLGLLISCNMRPTPDSSVPKTKALIFIPGYKGSLLESKHDGTLEWICSSDVIFGSQPLTLPQPGLELRHSRELVPIGVMQSVTVIPLLKHVQVYGGFLSALHQQLDSSTAIVELPYDWRRDFMDLVALLDHQVEELRASGANEIDVIAHSMGGVALAYYIRYGTQDPDLAVENWSGAAKLNHAIFVGTPFRGSISIFKDLSHGDKIVWNRSLLNAEAVSSFPSAYQLLPFPGDDALFGDKIPKQGFLYDAAQWREHHWGVFALADDPSATAASNRLEFTKSQLMRSAKLHSLLVAPLANKPSTAPGLRVLAISGLGRDSAESCAYDSFKDTFICPTDESPENPGKTLDGDGVLTAESTELPAAYLAALSGEKVNIRDEHLEMLNNDVLRRKFFSFLGAR